MINTGEEMIPHNKIICVSERPEYEPYIDEMVLPLRGEGQRDSLGVHAVHCLPVVIGNQYGFVLKSMVTWSARWNGGPHSDDTRVQIHDAPPSEGLQTVSSHFGNGIITVQNRFSFRTAPGINMMVLDPPNYFLPNLSNLFAVVETDNLRRDFTFNLKIVKPGVRVKVNKGDIISGLIPIPRYFVDDFSIGHGKDYFAPETLADENRQIHKFAKLRNQDDITKPQAVGKLYWRGLDADDNEFEDHQRKLRPAGWTDA